MKKILFTTTLFVASILGCIFTSLGTNKLSVTEAEEKLYSFSVNRKSLTKQSFFYFVTTENGNKIDVPTPHDEAGEEGIYALYYGGGGDSLNSTNPIQSITSISISFKFPTATVQTHGGYFELYTGDYQIPYYSPEESQHQESFNLTNNNDELQTQTFAPTEPSKCNYIAWWYSVPAIYEEGYAIIYDITVTYRCI